MIFRKARKEKDISVEELMEILGINEENSEAEMEEDFKYHINIHSDNNGKTGTAMVSGTDVGLLMGLSALVSGLKYKAEISQEEIIEAVAIGLKHDLEKGK